MKSLFINLKINVPWKVSSFVPKDKCLADKTFTISDQRIEMPLNLGEKNRNYPVV